MMADARRGRFDVVMTWACLDRAAILSDRQHGRSLAQLAKTYRASRTTIHRVLQERAGAVPKGVENVAS
jgi:hypothetical protein